MIAPGLENFHKVSDGLYRGAQPSAEGLRQLKARGVRTVVNLRTGDTDSPDIAGTGLEYVHISFKPWHAEDEDVVKFLRVVTDPQRTPVFVHCQYGSDRTGTMCAVYRMAVQGWSRDDAIREMVEGGYGFHYGGQKLIRYLQDVDVEALRAKLGTVPPATLPAGMTKPE